MMAVLKLTFTRQRREPLAAAKRLPATPGTTNARTKPPRISPQRKQA
jgi:hypothetical protein